MTQAQLILHASPAAIARLRRLVKSAGGDEAFIKRVLAMAAKPAPPNLGDRHRLGKGRILAAVHLSAEEVEEIKRRAEPLGFTRGGWMRALFRAHVRRQPQLPPETLKETSAVRYELQRVGHSLREIARCLDERDAKAASADVERIWRQARGELVALRATLAGNLLWWDGEDD